MNNLIPEHLAAYAHRDSLQIEGEHRCFSLSCRGRNTFHIRYYGEPFDGLITDTDEAPVKIVAVEAVSGNKLYCLMERNMAITLCFATNIAQIKSKTEC